jgi:hypothetical protein
MRKGCSIVMAAGFRPLGYRYLEQCGMWILCESFAHLTHKHALSIHPPSPPFPIPPSISLASNFFSNLGM